MAFTLNPAFSFNLNRILVGSVKFGRFDGIHVCLTAVTSTDKVILHNPYKRLSETNNRLSWTDSASDVAVLNFNQEIRAIETGCLSPTDTKDVLVIGSPTQLLSMFFLNNYFDFIARFLITYYSVFSLSCGQQQRYFFQGNYGRHSNNSDWRCWHIRNAVSFCWWKS